MRNAEREVRNGIASQIREWLSSALFRSYLWRFLLLWVVGKVANAGTAAIADLPPLAFRPGAEVVACGAELVVLWVFIRRVNEDLLLGNLGLDLRTAFAPLVLLHFALSAALALGA